jgi:hypothetical protein
MDLTKKSMRTRKQVRAAKARTEARIIKAVRARVAERDGYCWFGQNVVEDGLGPCRGPSEWAHLGEWRRSRTRGMAPEERHHTRGSLMLCHWHHALLDAHEFDLEYGPDGADGPLTVVRKVA